MCERKLNSVLIANELNMKLSSKLGLGLNDVFDSAGLLYSKLDRSGMFVQKHHHTFIRQDSWQIFKDWIGCLQPRRGLSFFGISHESIMVKLSGQWFRDRKVTLLFTDDKIQD